VARVGGLGVANPETSFSQDEALSLLGLRGDEFAERIFERAGVRRRFLDLGPQTLMTTLQERAPQTERRLLELAVRAIDDMDLDPGAIGTVITSTYCSLGGPTLAHRLIEHYTLDPAVDKYHVLGVGCAGAVPLIKLANQALIGHPGKDVLVVGAELFSAWLTSASPGDERTKIVGCALGGDGCAAVRVTADPSASGPGLVAPSVHQIPGSGEAVRFTLTAEDSYLHIGRELPMLVATGVRPLVEEYLRANAIEWSAIDHWLVHPGGPAILDAARTGLSLPAAALAVSYDVLADYGNIGTSASFFVLKHTDEQRQPDAGDLGLMITIGPGVTIGLMLIVW
jgi:predicted naringenin-chalcone synthase